MKTTHVLTVPYIVSSEIIITVGTAESLMGLTQGQHAFLIKYCYLQLRDLIIILNDLSGEVHIYTARSHTLTTIEEFKETLTPGTTPVLILQELESATYHSPVVNRFATPILYLRLISSMSGS